MPVFLIYAACAFASGFALRLVDPIVLPVAGHFAVTATTAAMLNTAYALPYALAQPFLGPIGDRFGKQRCIQVCVAGLALMLAAGAFADSFAFLLATRVLAGIFAGGLIPLVLAGIGDTYAMSERQVALGRMLFAIISGQMLGSVVSGFANVAFGWRSALFIASGVGAVAAIVAWTQMPAAPRHGDSGPPASFAALYGRVFANPKAAWLYAAVMLEGALFYRRVPVHGRAPARDHGARRQRDLDRDRHRPRRLRHRRPALRRQRAHAAAPARRAPDVPARLGRRRRLLRRARVRAALVARRRGDALRRARLLHAAQLDADRGDRARALGPRLGRGPLRLRLLRRPSGLGPLVFGGLLHALGPQISLVIVAAAIVVLGRVVVSRIVDRPRAATVVVG